MPDELILASRSPRRKQLLEMMGLPVRVVPSVVPETRQAGESPQHHAERLARTKAASVEGGFVLGADTIVVLDGMILEKPLDEDDALRMLRLLQDRTHQVVTSCALKSSRGIETATDVTSVSFRATDDDQLRRYIATGEPMDKAGAYGIQGYGAALVDRIEGDFFGVMGLPIRLVLDLLERAGWRYTFTR